MKIFKIIGVSLLSIFLTGCLFKRDTMEDIDIYTTIYPVNYLITYLYGDYSTIHSIYPTGVEVNEFNLSDKKIKEYSKSDLFVFNSLDKDRDYAIKMSIENNNLKMIDASGYGNITYNYSVKELWLSPNNYLMMAQNIKDGLNEFVSNPYILEEVELKYQELNIAISKLDANLKESIKYANYKTIVADDDTFKFLEHLLGENKEFTVLSLDKTEEVNITYTVLENDTLDKIAKEFEVSKESIMNLNKLDNESIKKGQTLEITTKTISANTINKVKKLIEDGEIKYIYSLDNNQNDITKSLLENYDVELIVLNDMNTIDGGVTNSNENYLTIMNNNIDLLKKELYK